MRCISINIKYVEREISVKKIGILTCARSNDVCARVGCLTAFNNRTYFFKDYETDAQLAAMMTCNGCTRDTETGPSETPGLLEKVDRLVNEGISIIHVGVCRMHNGKECPRITEICELMENKNIHVVRGTHRE